MAIQRNAIVAPFSVNSPLLDSDSKGTIQKKGEKPSSGGTSSGVVAITHQRWLQSLANGINASLQISDEVPASSTASGQPGTVVPFAGGFYFCVGSNSWLKFIGAPF